MRIGSQHSRPTDQGGFFKEGGGKKRKYTGRMCPAQVPGGGFQVAGCSDCPVSPEQTPHPKKEDGKKTPS